MTIPQLPPITIDPSRLGMSPSLRSAERAVSSITPGAVISVVLRENYQGNSGVFYRGAFIPAQLPKNMPDGAKVAVEVQQHADKLILKLLHEPRVERRGAEQQLADLIAQLLPELDLHDVKPDGIKTSRQLPPEIAKLFSEASRDEESGADAPELKRIIKSLLAERFVLSERELDDPALLKRAMVERSVERVRGNVREAIDSLIKLAVRDAPEPPRERLARELVSAIEKLLAMSEPIDPVLPPAAFLEPVLPGSAGVPAPRASIAQLSPSTKALVSLMTALIRITEQEPPPAPGSPLEPFGQLLRELAAALTQLRERGAQDEEFRAALRERLPALKEFADKQRERAAARGPVTEGLRALEMLERSLSTEEVLAKLSPVMQAAGEPAFIVIPAIMHGLLSQLGISVERQENHQTDGPGSEGRPDSRGYERIRIALPLPALGTVGIDLAHRASELALTLTFEREESRAFVEARLGPLGKRLAELGINEPAVALRTGQPHETVPEWVSSVARRSIVA